MYFTFQMVFDFEKITPNSKNVLQSQWPNVAKKIYKYYTLEKAKYLPVNITLAAAEELISKGILLFFLLYLPTLKIKFYWQNDLTFGLSSSFRELWVI